MASRDRTDQALRNLAYMRSLPEDSKYVREEFDDICNALAADRAKAGTGFIAPITSLLSSASLLRRLSVCIAIFACQNGTGINAINYYSPTIFKSIGVTVRSARSSNP